MFRPRIIPVLLLSGKGLVKTTKYKDPVYIGDPINAVKIFNDLYADELIFLDINATIENRTIATDLVKDIGDEAFMPFGVGGGINSVAKAVELVNNGAEKIIVNTLLQKNPHMIKEIANTIGSQSVVVSLDVNKTFLGKERFFINSGKTSTKLSPIDAVKLAEDMGAGEIILNYIPFDGVMKGYNLELIEKISQEVSIPVVASCGAGSLIDFGNAYSRGAHALAAGSLFVYQGTRKGVLINYPEKNELLNIFK
jgi:imidazole glycerol-phosphate synthase subunit HisF